MEKKSSTFNTESAPAMFVIACIEFASWKWLSLTTGVLAYGLMDSWASAQFSGHALTLVRFLGVFLFFLLIDMGLSRLIAFYMKTKNALLNPSPAKAGLRHNALPRTSGAKLRPRLPTRHIKPGA